MSTPLVIAHRGASAAFVENTIDAFAGAVEMKSDAVELDVRRSLDGVLVVHHDAHLPDGAAICDVVFGDLPPHVPTLEAALDACGTLVVNIEIKNTETDPGFEPNRAIADDVVHIVQARAMGAAALISSFDLPTIDRVRHLDASIATAFLIYRGDAQASIELCAARGHGTIHPWDRQVDAEFMAFARAHELTVNVWTIDDPARMVELAALGVDGIVTNVPDVALATLAAL